MMNDSTNPIRASASIRPMPMNIVPRTRPAASGWRAMASTDFPISTPIPIPGPMAARPYARPFPIELTSPVVAASRPSMCVTTPTISPPCASMLLRHRARDVGRREHAEDERLQARDEDLESDQGHPDAERNDAQNGGEAGHESERPQEENGQQEVPGHHVGEQPEGEGDGAQDDDREELDRGEQDVQQLRGSGREHDQLQIAEQAVPPDPDTVVDDPRRQRHHQGEPQPRVQGEAEAGDHLQDVAQED